MGGFFRVVLYFFLFIGLIFFIHNREKYAASQAVLQFNIDQQELVKKATKEYQDEIIILNQNIITLSKENDKLKVIVKKNLNEAKKFIASQREHLSKECKRQTLKIYNGTVKRLKGGGIY